MSSVPKSLKKFEGFSTYIPYSLEPNNRYDGIRNRYGGKLFELINNRYSVIYYIVWCM